MPQRHAGGAPLAVVAVGLVVAAANRTEDLGADRRLDCAHALNVARAAAPGRIIAERSVRTLEREDAAAPDRASLRLRSRNEHERGESKQDRQASKLAHVASPPFEARGPA